MAPGLNPEVQRALAALSAVLERGFRARVARRLRDRGMPAVEIAEVLASPGPASIGTCPRQKATSPDTGAICGSRHVPAAGRSHGHWSVASPVPSPVPSPSSMR